MSPFEKWILIYTFGLAVWSALISRGHIDTDPHRKVYVAAFIWPISTVVILCGWVKQRAWP